MNEPESTGWQPPGWLSGKMGKLRRLLTNPLGFILSVILPFLVSTFVIDPTLWTIDLIGTGTEMLGDAIADAGRLIGLSLQPAREALLNLPEQVITPLQESLMSAGLGAPIAASIASVVVAAVATMIVFLLLRVIISLVPGLSGVIP